LTPRPRTLLWAEYLKAVAPLRDEYQKAVAPLIIQALLAM